MWGRGRESVSRPAYSGNAIISNRLDSKALKAALPDVYGQFCKASTSRRFTIA